MRKLSTIEDNCFTTHIFDVIIPEIKVDSSDPISYMFLVMDYEETDMDTVLTSYKKYQLNWEHLTTLMYNILCSVHFLHSANLIHRDLKPSNILLNYDCVPKICDFGLARSVPKGMPDYSIDFSNASLAESSASLRSTMATFDSELTNKRS